ncbi:hypothetical protein [Psychroserpens sp. MEBiC05023]
MKASDKPKLRIVQSLLFFIVLAINLTMCQAAEAQENNQALKEHSYPFVNNII